MSVLAGIAASDAACCAALGRRSRSPDHRDATRLIAEVAGNGPAMANALSRLLDVKDAAQYGLINVSRQQLTAVLRRARTLIDLAEQIVLR
jgi:hypothetical protein